MTTAGRGRKMARSTSTTAWPLAACSSLKPERVAAAAHALVVQKVVHSHIISD